MGDIKPWENRSRKGEKLTNSYYLIVLIKYSDMFVIPCVWHILSWNLVVGERSKVSIWLSTITLLSIIFDCLTDQTSFVTISSNKNKSRAITIVEVKMKAIKQKTNKIYIRLKRPYLIYSYFINFFSIIYLFSAKR